MHKVIFTNIDLVIAFLNIMKNIKVGVYDRFEEKRNSKDNRSYS